MALSIESLPPEIQRLVLEHLSTHDHSLRAFACVNRICHIIASPLIYHTMRIGVDPGNISFPNFHKRKQSSKGSTKLQYVKCLAIYKAQRLGADSSPDSKDTVLQPRFQSENASALDGCLQWPKELEKDAKIPLSNDAWLPLADLILQLPSLSDLIFLLPTEFPECLLDRIHRSRPECRLHIENLFLCNLVTASTDSCDFRLASSPCIFSIGATHICNHNPKEDKSTSYHQDIVALMTSGLAPNLKEVTLVYHDFWFACLTTPTLPQWKGFGENTRKDYEKSRGNLQCLRLKHAWRITEGMLDYWSAQTDFTKLQTLQLDAHLPTDTLSYLATEFHLPCLQKLVLGRLRREREDSDDHAEAVNKLLRCLSPLRSLTLDEWYPEISIDALAIVHGHCLLELKLLDYPGEDLTNDDLEALGRHCITLRDLTLSLRRSQGDLAEASLYKALGSLPNLQSITLNLHVAQRYDYWDNDEDEEGKLSNPAFHDEFDRQVPPELANARPISFEVCNGAMREQLINCAIDAKLARSIFDAISFGKPQISLPLQELNIKITGAGDFGNIHCSHHYLSVLSHLCRPWRITRSIRCDRRIETQRTEPVPSLFKPPPSVLEGYLEAIWRRIWPQKMSEDWQSDWHSFPISKVA